MKCIRCDRDSKYSERTNKKCPGCQGEFAFEPREGDILTDMAFKSAILAVSSNGAVRWGVENLYYEICRRRRRFRATPGLIAGLILASGVFVVVAVLINLAFLLVSLVGAIFTILAVWNWRNPNPLVKVTHDDFSRMWDRWCTVHGTPEGVIIRQPQPATKKPVEPDIADYSFDRAVICDRARTVDVLVANNFHFENNCAILSIEGYPPGPFETVKAMLKRNPKLEVFALHDASLKGCRLAHQLATDPAWFAGGAKVIDVGLRPVHSKPFVGLFQEGKGAVVPEGEGITAEEAEWLAKYTLELAVIRPEQVLKRLYRAINRTPQGAADGETAYIASSGNGNGGGVIVDQQCFAEEAGDADGGGGIDGFG
jgi:hypothetical protein